MDTLAFGCILPATGRIRDFHPLERALAGRTNTRGPSTRVLFDCLCAELDAPPDEAPLYAITNPMIAYPMKLMIAAMIP